MRLVVHNQPGYKKGYLNLYPLKPRLQRQYKGTRFQHLSRLSDVRKCYSSGSQYHTSLWSNGEAAYADPGAQAAIWQIMQYFGSHTWTVNIPITYIRPSRSVARIPTSAHIFRPVLEDMIYVRQQYSCHDCDDLTISM